MKWFRYYIALFVSALLFGCGVTEKQAHQTPAPGHRTVTPAEVRSQTHTVATTKDDVELLEERNGAPTDQAGAGASAGRLPATAPAKESLATSEQKSGARGRTERPDAQKRKLETLDGQERLAAPAPAISVVGQVAGEPFARHVPTPQDTEKYGHLEENPIKLAAEHPVSTFSIDVDTGSYANVRRFLNEGRLPPHDAVRVEELINYFPYAYARPNDDTRAFAVHTEMSPTPWNTGTRLLRVGIKGREIARQALPPANLVFLIDVSGSMDQPNKLPLLKDAFALLTDELRPQDKVSIVVYAGASGLVLAPTSGGAKQKIANAIQRLSPGGSTHGAAGIELAYRVAQQGFVPGGINRVLLATDGDFNVGVTNFEALKNLIEQKRRSGISLSTLGFGTGNYNDQLMEQLADAGNGNYTYVDNLNEARKALVDEFTSTMAIIAKDVKIQIEFNPDRVAEYRLIGHENRLLKREDFNNDKIDAGEIGAGHSVTALYEIRLHGEGKSLIDPLRYQSNAPASGDSGELALLRLRHKAPESDESELMEAPILEKTIRPLNSASTEFRFAVAVAAFGQELKGGKYLGKFGFGEIQQLARQARAEDKFGYRAEFLKLVATAERLTAGQTGEEISMSQH
ncbi:MAG: VWA domain-containing protein [Burkholderiales bacterium]